MENQMNQVTTVLKMAPTMLSRDPPLLALQQLNSE